MRTYLNNYSKNLSFSNPFLNSIFTNNAVKAIDDFIDTFNFSDGVVDTMNTQYKSSYLMEDGQTFAFPTPGYDKSELKIVINKNTLQVSAKSEREEFKNSLSLSTLIPKTLDASKEITTEYKNGMLFVKFEKKDEGADQREIPIV
jgi:HSP20 family molecular chaperone IbpA